MLSQTDTFGAGTRELRVPKLDSNGNIGNSCIANEACGVGGICSMNQEDTDGDGVGDVCDSSTQQIPALSEWGMIIFLTLILGISVVMLLRRREI